MMEASFPSAYAKEPAMPVNVGPVETLLIAAVPLLCVISLLALFVVLVVKLAASNNRRSAIQAQMQDEQRKPPNP
jgi:hypothetical protein